MKFQVNELTEVVSKDDGTVSLGVKARGKAHTIEFTAGSQQNLLTALLASSRDPLAPTSKRIHPAGLARFQIDDDVGISFLLGQDIAIHVVMPRQLSSALQKFLETFDDPSTWVTSKPH